MPPETQRQWATAHIDSPKWFNSPVSFHESTLDNIRSFIPQFERRAFALTQSNKQHTCINERLDTIIRKPIGKDSNFIPVGIVSKGYALVQHTDVLDAVEKAFDQAKISREAIRAELEITEYGERIALSLYLPDEFSFDPGDGNNLELRLECFNSVDGSTRFRALMGWFRVVCRNGLIIGTTISDVRRKHVGDLGISDIQFVLKSGIVRAETDKKNFKKWRARPIPPDFNSWVNDELRKMWGFKAAARIYHISRTGHDVKIVGPYKKNNPLNIPVIKALRVPGAPAKSNNLYDLSQNLAWVARQRRDIQEQLEWREKIPDLLDPLLR